MSKTYIGIDNGTSGAIAILPALGEQVFMETPTFMQQNYTKTKGNISRLDYSTFFDTMDYYKHWCDSSQALVLLERPMVNPGRFKATISAVRCLEAQLVALEELSIPYQYIDSKEWQKALLPSGIKGSPELKKASTDIGLRLFPQFEKLIKKQKDADALLIAEYARRNRL